jgi:hypothetical protein
MLCFSFDLLQNAQMARTAFRRVVTGGWGQVVRTTPTLARERSWVW